MKGSRRTREASKECCGLKPHCSSVLPYKALCARAGGAACSSVSARAANKTAWEKISFLLLSAVQAARWSVCAFAKPSMEQAERSMSALHLIVHAVTPSDGDFPRLQ